MTNISKKQKSIFSRTIPSNPSKKVVRSFLYEFILQLVFCKAKKSTLCEIYRPNSTPLSYFILRQVFISFSFFLSIIRSSPRKNNICSVLQHSYIQAMFTNYYLNLTHVRIIYTVDFNFQQTSIIFTIY